MLGTIALRRYVDSAAARGYPSRVTLADSGVDYLQLAEPHCRITLAQYRGIVQRLTSLTHEEGIDLAESTFKELGDLGVIGQTSASSRTVRDTYRAWTRFAPTLLGMIGQLEIREEDSASVTFGVASPDVADPLYRFSVEELLTMVKKVSRSPQGSAPSVALLALAYPAPRHAERYDALFGCPIRFGAPQTTIRVWKEWFDHPFAPHDPEFNEICLQYCESLLRRFDRDRPLTAQLRRLLKSSNGKPPPSLDEAAAALNLGARTLRRKLLEEGTGYREQLDDFRAEQAVKLLAHGGLSTKEVSFALGFNDESAFRYAFKSWTGKTVSQYLAANNTDRVSRS